MFSILVTVASDYGEIESHPESTSNIKRFINKYNWKGINYPSKVDDWKTFEKNNSTIALNILYIKDYVSKINSNCEKKNSVNDFKRRKKRMTLSCSKKIVSIITWNNFKT